MPNTSAKTSRKKMTKEEWTRLAPLFISGISLFFLVIGALAIFIAPQQSLDLRKAASVQNGLVKITSTFQDITPGNTNANIALMVNTQGLQTDGVQVVFDIGTNTFTTLSMNVPTTTGLQVGYQKIDKTASGFHVSLILIPQTIGQTFSTTTPTTFVFLNFQPTQAGQIQVDFDQTNSLSTVHGTNPPQNQLNTVPQLSYYTVGVISATATPVPSATATPVPTATATPLPTATATPLPTLTPVPTVTPTPTIYPTATPTATPFAGYVCNAGCNYDSQCGVNLRCYNNQCRLAANPNDVNCNAAPDQGLQRQCNQYCANTGECASGYTCFYNQCRLPNNPDNANCSGVTPAVTQAMSLSCNSACNSNRDCATNLRCYYGACRLATNPTSGSCSAAATTPTSRNLITDQINYPTGPTKGQEIPLPILNADGTYATATPAALPTPDLIGTLNQVGAGNGSTKSSTPKTFEQPKTGNFLQDLMTTLQERGISLPNLAIGLGILLLILAILVAFFNRGKKTNTPPGKPMTGQSFPTQPPTPTEKNLQAKIQDLQKQQQQQPKPMAPQTPQPFVKPATPVVEPVKPVTPPAQPQPIAAAPRPAVAPLTPPPSTIQPAPRITPVAATTTTPVPQQMPAVPTPATPTPTESASTMMERLKAKGISNPTGPSTGPISNPTTR